MIEKNFTTKKKEMKKQEMHLRKTTTIQNLDVCNIWVASPHIFNLKFNIRLNFYIKFNLFKKKTRRKLCIE